MTDLFKNKYRIASARLANWNYSSNAAYFITICTKERQCFFGDIVDGKMSLNEIGKLAETEWLKTPQIRPDMNIELDDFIVMPNHFHGIIIIGENNFNNKYANIRRDAILCVSTINKYQNSFGPQSKNLAAVIRGFKSAVTKQARIIKENFQWQTRFHDHIIRDIDSFNKIKEYIISNPGLWQSDKFYKP